MTEIITEEQIMHRARSKMQPIFQATQLGGVVRRLLGEILQKSGQDLDRVLTLSAKSGCQQKGHGGSACVEA